MAINFTGIAARLLQSAHTLVPQWLPGGRMSGAEWVCAGLQGGKGRSFSVNLNTGKWSEFAGGGDLKGGDLISLYAAINQVSQAEAAQQLDDGSNSPAPRHESPADANPAINAPVDYPQPKPVSESWGSIASIHPYFNDAKSGPILLVVRFIPPDSGPVDDFAKVRPCTWRKNKAGRYQWIWKNLPDNRPLLNVRALAKAPEARVLVVEGEKCQVAAQLYFDALDEIDPAEMWVAVTWAGGANAHSKTDWEPLKGRRVTLWPDADQPDAKSGLRAGQEAMAAIAKKLLPLAASLSVAVPPDSGLPHGWDCADALAEKIELEHWIKDHLKRISPADPEPAPPKGNNRSSLNGLNGHASAGAADSRALSTATTGELMEPAAVLWERLGLSLAANGIPHPTADNVERALNAHESFSKRVYFDTFRMRKIFINEDTSEREWGDEDTLNALIWLQRRLDIPKLQKASVRDGVDAAAARNKRNSLITYLDSLAWDGIPRLNNMMEDIWGAEDSIYSSDVGRCWLISMMARAYKPGCQVDTMPVFEGGQGARKSSALEILGGPYYAALPVAFGSRDFLQALDGTWLVEIPDMSGFKGRDIEHVKAIITTRSDRYCRRYSHEAGTYPRQCVFAATANRDDWNEDETGARRFWPIKVGGEVKLDLLRASRTQLLAEARARYLDGEPWWNIDQSGAKEQQEMRRPEDSWEPVVAQAIIDVTKYASPHLQDRVTIPQIFEQLGIELIKQGKSEQMRMSRILMSLGWIKKTGRMNGKVTKYWVKAAAWDSWVPEYPPK